MYDVQIGSKYTHHDWSMILKSKSIGLPEVKEEYIPIPSGDGSIDISEALRGEPSYGDRSLAFDFELKSHPHNWSIIKQQIAAYLHGRRHKVIVHDDPFYHYMARLKITAWNELNSTVEVTIEGVGDPYKYKNYPSVYQGSISSSGSIQFNCKNERRRVIPIITVSNNSGISFNGNQYGLTEGDNKLTSIVFSEGDNEIQVTGSPGTEVSISYTEGAF